MTKTFAEEADSWVILSWRYHYSSRYKSSIKLTIGYVKQCHLILRIDQFYLQDP